MVGSLEKILKVADVISEVRRAFEKISQLEQNQKTIAEALGKIDARVRELEAGLREARAEIKLEAVKEAQGTVNGAQSQLYQKLYEIETALRDVKIFRAKMEGQETSLIDGSG